MGNSSPRVEGKESLSCQNDRETCKQMLSILSEEIVVQLYYSKHPDLLCLAEQYFLFNLKKIIENYFETYVTNFS